MRIEDERIHWTNNLVNKTPWICGRCGAVTGTRCGKFLCCRECALTPLSLTDETYVPPLAAGCMVIGDERTYEFRSVLREVSG